MTQTISANNKVTIDTDFAEEPAVQPTYQMGAYSALDLIYSNHYTGITAGGSYNLPDCSGYSHLLFMVNVKSLAGTSPTVTFNIFLVDAFGFATGGFFSVWASGALSTPQQALRGIGPGSDSIAPVPANVQFSWAVGGTSPVVAFDITIYGKRGE